MNRPGIDGGSDSTKPGEHYSLNETRGGSDSGADQMRTKPKSEESEANA